VYNQLGVFFKKMV